MAKKILMAVFIIALAVLALGLYVGHQGLEKLEDSYTEALTKQNFLTKKTQEEKNKLEEELKKALEAKTQLEQKIKEQDLIMADLLKKSQDSLLLEEQVKALNDKMQATVDSCQIKPKPPVVVKKPVVKKVEKKPEPIIKVVEKVVVKEVVKPAEPKTIVINKIYIQDKQKGTKRLIKEDRKLIKGDAYPNDLLK